jgi:hypothetical protein
VPSTAILHQPARFHVLASDSVMTGFFYIARPTMSRNRSHVVYRRHITAMPVIAKTLFFTKTYRRRIRREIYVRRKVFAILPDANVG